MDAEKEDDGKSTADESFDKATVEGKIARLLPVYLTVRFPRKKPEKLYRTPLITALATLLGVLVGSGIAMWAERKREERQIPKLKAIYTVTPTEQPFLVSNQPGACTSFATPKSSDGVSPSEHMVRIVNESPTAAVKTVLRITVSPPAVIHQIAPLAPLNCPADVTSKSLEAKNNTTIEMAYQRKLYRGDDELVLYLGISYSREKIGELARATISFKLVSDNGGYYYLEPKPLFPSGVPR